MILITGNKKLCAQGDKIVYALGFKCKQHGLRWMNAGQNYSYCYQGIWQTFKPLSLQKQSRISKYFPSFYCDLGSSRAQQTVPYQTKLVNRMNGPSLKNAALISPICFGGSAHPCVLYQRPKWKTFSAPLDVVGTVTLPLEKEMFIRFNFSWEQGIRHEASFGIPIIHLC